MLRRYLVAFVGAVVGAGVVSAFYYFGLDSQPDYRAAAAGALLVAGFLMAKGEHFGLIPPSDEVDRPTSLFSDEKGRRR